MCSRVLVHRRLLLVSCWPLALLFVAASGAVGWELRKDRRRGDATLVAPRGGQTAVLAGLQRSLPLVLVL
eukprot:788634-Prymnesium_polylepis.1